MIAADSSVWIDYFSGRQTENADKLDVALAQGQLVFPSPVQFEVLSSAGMTADSSREILRIPALQITNGFWERAATLRRDLLRKGMKARAMDCLIAQNCIDHSVPLIAEDSDFRKFQKAGLKLG